MAFAVNFDNNLEIVIDKIWNKSIKDHLWMKFVSNENFVQCLAKNLFVLRLMAS